MQHFDTSFVTGLYNKVGKLIPPQKNDCYKKTIELQITKASLQIVELQILKPLLQML